ncbi:hypothetical protein O9363_10485 [Proteus vulgaris]|uniref:DUF7210 family protein n=1 Tax=Proteus vulgaris TaxID=585 RepID=UPI0025773E7D|nr:hypothetical protein [Proteus vulgaris]MDM3560557.1 hypothetical protein [Proteus vulgaris]
MNLIILRAIYFGGVVVTEGKEIETLEQHGRELIQKGYAKEKEVVHFAIEPEPEPEPKKNTKAKKEK